MPRTTTRAVALFVLTAALAGCGEGRPTVDTPERRQQREAAYRQACASAALARQAEEDLEVLERSLAAVDPNDPASAISRAATQAALTYSRAYHRHAELRAAAYTYLDSAVNHAATPADSARYVESATRFSIRMPQEGTVEANVLTSYQSSIAALLNQPNHPCNWDFPF